MKGVMAALGHEVDLPPFVVEHCAAAQLELDVDGVPTTLTRLLQEKFSLTVAADQTETVYSSPAEFLSWFARVHGAQPRKLTSKSREEAALYPSVFYPLFWVDQDRGWTTAYSVPPERNFILDQRQEVIRFALGLPERHPFRSREELDSVRRALERAEKALELQRFLLERMRSAGEPLDLEREAEARRRRELLREELRANEVVVESVRTISSRYDAEIEELESSRQTATTELAVVERQRTQLHLSLTQIEGEIEVLTANVQASELLRQFCDNPSCSLFLQSAESYGRALLFMKDQIKDLNTADKGIARAAGEADRRLQMLSENLVARRAARQAAIARSDVAEASSRLSQVTRELVAVELYLARLEQYRAEISKLENQLDRKEELSRRVAELRLAPGKRESPHVADARASLSARMSEWLQVLGARNLGAAATFDEGFSPHVGGSEFTATSHQSGSSRTRIVLAFHAAILEVSLDLGGNHPGILILDAPKQHELAQRDFEAYVARMRDVSRRHQGAVQMVFSMAHISVDPADGDVVWLPKFDTLDGLMYLSKVLSD
jgi:prefoldin subunit 5